ncbi:MAG: tRNA 2-thiouridine(34) synthase MnmA [Gammaproteobacteria bacterium]|nr:MAG: tRNA 2-thiouridine(34) synthase MnmA [Gammaproteobacteria bacterium]
MKAPQDTKVIIGLSGGVDSAVAAHLLLQQGYQVEGLFMKNWEEDDDTDYCTAAVDLADAEQICEVLGINLRTANFAAEYWDRVFEYFLTEYRAGRTPNPDIICNKEIKFKAFLDYALLLGADFIATGHYAQRVNRGDEALMLRGLDVNKDQTYFLYTLGQKALNHTIFPLGEYEKPRVREIADELGFANSNKKDSTGICFIGERKFADFLERFIAAQPGEILSDQGKVIGNHNGLMFHTLGQRKGLGIGGLQESADDPWYVYGKNLKNNQLLVCQGGDNILLMSDNLRCSQLHWINEKTPEETFTVTCKVRYRQPDQMCKVTLSESSAHLEFADLQRAVTPGQSVVFYREEVCLGGAIIDETWLESSS